MPATTASFPVDRPDDSFVCAAAIVRVLVATDGHALVADQVDSPTALTSLQAGRAIGRAFADRGAQVAVTPLGAAGRGFASAAADLIGDDPQTNDPHTNDPHTNDPHTGVISYRSGELTAGIDEQASSGDLGRAVAHALAARSGPSGSGPSGSGPSGLSELIIELPASNLHDGGAGLLAALGARSESSTGSLTDGVAGLINLAPHRIDLESVRAHLGGVRLTLVCGADEVARPLVGLRGITSVKGHGSEIDTDPATLLAIDQALVDLAEALGADPQLPGSGAGGGVGLAVQALGGRVLTGSQWCAQRAGLADTIAAADLVVSGGGRLDFGTMGGEVLAEVTRLATAALRPLIVIAGTNFISPRELRSVGVEAAYAVHPGDEGAEVTADDLAATSASVAASWTW